jgi:hypothetical protein
VVLRQEHKAGKKLKTGQLMDSAKPANGTALTT